MKSKLETKFEKLLNLLRIKGWVREFKFCPTRRWRFDFAWPERKIAVEIEGGVWINGAHNRGAHFLSDMEKYNWATINGWRVLRYTNKTLENGVLEIKNVLKND